MDVTKRTATRWIQGPRIWVLLLGLAWAAGAMAYNSEHGPYPKDRQPKLVALEKLEPVLDESTGVRPCAAPGEPELILELSGGEGLPQVGVLRAGQVAFQKTVFADCCAVYTTSVYAAKLNEDGLWDFVLIPRSSGCGLAGDFTQIGFLLSEGDGYRLTTVETLCADESDFVVLDGRAYFLQASLQKVDKCKDGKNHNFWVYNLLGFEGGKPRIANAPENGFPKTVWYSFAPNHAETTLLDAAAKEAVLRTALGDIFWKPKPDNR